MLSSATIKVLIVEDDEDDYIIARDLLSEIPRKKFTIDWVKSFEPALKELLLHRHDICLLDYRLGPFTGVELLRSAIAQGCQIPFILLTGNGEFTVDMEAMEAGAADYLVKNRLDSNSMERSIRYAMQRQSAAARAAFDQARLAAFGAEIGFNLACSDPLDAILSRCAKAMVRYLDASVAQVFTWDPARAGFVPRASATLSGDARPDQMPPLSARLDLDLLTGGKPAIIRQRPGDLTGGDPELVPRESLVSFAAHPLVLEGRLVGLMSIYAARPLSDQVCEEMSSVANGLALCIQRKLSDEALGVSEDKFRSVVENIREVIFELDASGRWTFLNPAWTAITGRDVKTSIGTCFWEHLHPDDRAHSRESFQQLMRGQSRNCHQEKRYLGSDGKIRWVEFHAEAIVVGESPVTGASGRLTDVTARRLAESQIAKLAAFPRFNPNPVLEFAADGTLSYANDATRNLCTLLGQVDIPDILPANSAAIVRECLLTGRDKLRESMTLNNRTIIWSFFHVATSQVVHCYGADVTEVLNLEAQFRHVQKLECVGQLAAGVAHDFNNLITVIQGYSDLLLAKPGTDSKTSSALNQIGGAARRAAALTRQLLLFSRKQVIKSERLDVNGVLQGLAKMLPRLLGEDVVLETNWAPELPRIQGDAGMIEQVVMNLAVNARDAMPQGGQLSLTTKLVEVGAAHAALSTQARPGTFICITAADTGCGMDAKTMEKIFEPFFTTKGVGKGTGLGLATVYGITQQHQGWVEVSSEVCVGTAFKVFIPSAGPGDSATAKESPRSDFVRGGQETILVVEDEAVVRELAREVLKSYQYRVLEASSGTEALRIWDEQDGEVDLVLTDIVMPDGLNGRELAEKLIDRKPNLPILFTSGYNSELVDQVMDENVGCFMAKPYSPPQLAARVRSVLDARAEECGEQVAPVLG